MIGVLISDLEVESVVVQGELPSGQSITIGFINN